MPKEYAYLLGKTREGPSKLVHELTSALHGEKGLVV